MIEIMRTKIKILLLIGLEMCAASCSTASPPPTGAARLVFSPSPSANVTNYPVWVLAPSAPDFANGITSTNWSGTNWSTVTTNFPIPSAIPNGSMLGVSAVNIVGMESAMSAPVLYNVPASPANVILKTQ